MAHKEGGGLKQAKKMSRVISMTAEWLDLMLNVIDVKKFRLQYVQGRECVLNVVRSQPDGL